MLALVNYQARRTGDTYSIVQRDQGNIGTRIVIRTHSGSLKQVVFWGCLKSNILNFDYK